MIVIIPDVAIFFAGCILCVCGLGLSVSSIFYVRKMHILQGRNAFIADDERIDTRPLSALR